MFLFIEDTIIQIDRIEVVIPIREKNPDDLEIPGLSGIHNPFGKQESTRITGSRIIMKSGPEIIVKSTPQDIIEELDEIRDH
jgi:hypothetical protein